MIAHCDVHRIFSKECAPCRWARRNHDDEEKAVKHPAEHWRRMTVIGQRYEEEERRRRSA